MADPIVSVHAGTFVDQKSRGFLILGILCLDFFSAGLFGIVLFET